MLGDIRAIRRPSPLDWKDSRPCHTAACRSNGAAVAAGRLSGASSSSWALDLTEGRGRYPDDAVAQSKRVSMSVFAVFLSSDIPAAVRRLRAHYPAPRHFQLSDYLFLVRSESGADSVARRVGINSQGRLKGSTGVVLSLSPFYSGFGSRAMWDWLTVEEGTPW